MAARILPFTGEFIDPRERRVRRMVELLEAAYANPQNEEQRRFSARLNARLAAKNHQAHPFGEDE